MSDKIIDKIELIKELGDIKKFISNKKTKGEKLSPKEYFDFCELVESHRYKQPLLYLNLETAYELSQILPDLDEILSSVDKNKQSDKAALFYEMISKSSNCFARYESSKEDQTKLHSFIKDRIKEDNEKGLKFYTFFRHFKFERIKYTDLMDIVNLGKKNNFADYLFYQNNGPGGSPLDKDTIDKVFKNCDGILKQDSFAHFIQSCEDRAISKKILNKLFGVSFDFDIPVRQPNNEFSFYLLCRKCEKGAIDKQTLEKIFSKLKIEQYFLTESDIENMLPAFDTEAQEYLKNEFKKMGLLFNFEVKKQKTLADFSKFAGELKEKIIFENWQDCLKLMACAPDFDDSKNVWLDGRTFLFNDNIVDGDFCANIGAVKDYAGKVIDEKTSKGEKFELNELKAMVLPESWPACESYFAGLETKEEFDKKNKALMACVPEKIDFVYLYWICQFYDTKYEWCDKLCIMDEDTVTFYVDRLDESSLTNQYMLFSFLNAINPGVINLDQAKKLLKNFVKIKDDAYPKINDEDAKNFVSKFNDEAQEFAKNWLKTFETMEPQDWNYDSSKYNSEDKENKDKNDGESISTDTEEHYTENHNDNKENKDKNDGESISTDTEEHHTENHNDNKENKDKNNGESISTDAEEHHTENHNDNKENKDKNDGESISTDTEERHTENHNDNKENKDKNNGESISTDTEEHHTENHNDNKENKDKSEEHEEIINTDTKKNPTENQDDLVLSKVINKIKTSDKIDDEKLNFIESRLATLEKNNNDIRIKLESLKNIIKEALQDINKKLENCDQNLDLNNIVKQVEQILRAYPGLSETDKDKYFKELKGAKDNQVKLKEVLINIISYLFKFMAGQLGKSTTFSRFVKVKRQKGIIDKINDKISRDQPKESKQSENNKKDQSLRI